jgi:hypothetical protein
MNEIGSDAVVQTASLFRRFCRMAKPIQHPCRALCSSRARRALAHSARAATLRIQVWSFICRILSWQSWHHFPHEDPMSTPERPALEACECRPHAMPAARSGARRPWPGAATARARMGMHAARRARRSRSQPLCAEARLKGCRPFAPPFGFGL